MTFHAAWKWLNDNGGALGVIVGVLVVVATLLPILWAAVQYIKIKRADERRLQFTTYHSLVKQLVERENPDQPMRLDRQIAVIFELRTFKRYFPVTLRILKGLKEDWSDYGPADKRKRLMEELDLAIVDLERKV